MLKDQLASLGLDDAISSVQCFDGGQISLWPGDIGVGDKLTIFGDIPDLSQFPDANGGHWGDVASSLEVSP